MTRDDPILRMALLAGLYEALAIVHYDVWMSDPTLRAVAASVAVLVSIVCLHLVIWGGIGWILSRGVRPALVVPLTFSCWVIVVALGRELLQDRTIRWGWRAVALGLVVAWLLSLPRLREARAWVREVVSSLAVISVAFFSLLGRVPDYSFPASYQLLFAAATAAVALAARELILRRPKWAAAAAALVLALGLGAALFRGHAEGPNVLWILVDTTRRDHVQPFGDVVSTPAIAKLASEGVLFEDAVTVVPKTPASVASFLTGSYAHDHGIRTLYDRLGPQNETIAEAFSAAGYATGAFVNNAWLSRGRGFGQGFDRFHGFYEVERPWGAFRYVSWIVAVDQLGPGKIGPFDGQTSSKRLTDRLIRRLAQAGDRPFFLYAHYFEPHWPYFPPPELARRHGAPEDGRTVVNFIKETPIGRGLMIFQNPLPDSENEAARRLYRGEIENTMEQIGRLVASLDDLGLSKDTLVVLTADHGHSLGEHRYYFHHGEFLYDVSLRIPLILRWPGRLPQGKVVESQVRSIDVAPTVAGLAGVRAFTGGSGGNLSRYWREEVDVPLEALIESDVTMFAENTRRPLGGVLGKLRAFRDGHHKLILIPSEGGLTLELYDLLADPDESRDLAQDPELEAIREHLLARLFEELPQAERTALAQLASGGVAEGEEEHQVDENELEMLRSLGYIQ